MTWWMCADQRNQFISRKKSDILAYAGNVKTVVWFFSTHFVCLFVCFRGLRRAEGFMVPDCQRH